MGGPRSEQDSDTKIRECLSIGVLLSGGLLQSSQRLVRRLGLSALSGHLMNSDLRLWIPADGMINAWLTLVIRRPGAARA